MSHHGAFAWCELVASDVPGARSFYEAVVGWSARDSGVPGMTYMTFQAGEVPVAGLMEMPAHMRVGGAGPHWTGYVAVDDVDAATARAKALGGTVHREPADIPGVGRFSVIADPHGAVIQLFRGQGEAPSPPPPGTPGHLGWHELMAGDLDAAFAFYSALFGWTRSTAVGMGGMGLYQLFAREGRDIGGMMTRPPQMPVPPHWRYYIQVAGIRDAVARIGRSGGTVTNGPHPVPGGSWIVQGCDPQGAHFALVSATE